MFRAEIYEKKIEFVILIIWYIEGDNYDKNLYIKKYNCL